MCSGPSLRWLQRSSKISHFMKLNELKFWKKLVDIVVHVSSEFQIDSRSYVCGVALQSCCGKSCFEKTSKQSFEMEQIQLGKTLKKEFEYWEAQIHYQDLRTKVWYVIIIQDTYIYVKPMYSIKVHIILKTYIHMQGPFCSTLTLTLILEIQGRN